MSSTPYCIDLFRRAAIVVLLGLGLAACGKKAPEAITPAAAADKVGGLFDQSPAEVKVLAERAVQAMAGDNLPQAHLLLQTLMARTDLTPEQRDVVTGAYVGVGERLRESAATGDEKAQEFQRMHQSSK
jgi:predicted small lipoprotein YifL